MPPLAAPTPNRAAAARPESLFTQRTSKAATRDRSDRPFHDALRTAERDPAKHAKTERNTQNKPEPRQKPAIAERSALAEPPATKASKPKPVSADSQSAVDVAGTKPVAQIDVDTIPADQAPARDEASTTAAVATPETSIADKAQEPLPIQPEAQKSHLGTTQAASVQPVIETPQSQILPDIAAEQMSVHPTTPPTSQAADAATPNAADTQNIAPAKATPQESAPTTVPQHAGASPATAAAHAPPIVETPGAELQLIRDSDARITTAPRPEQSAGASQQRPQAEDTPTPTVPQPAAPRSSHAAPQPSSASTTQQPANESVEPAPQSPQPAMSAAAALLAEDADPSSTPASARAAQVDLSIKVENASGQPAQAESLRPTNATPTQAALPTNPTPGASLAASLKPAVADQPTAASLFARTEAEPAPTSILRGISAMVNQRGGAMTMRLDPPELGQLRVQMTISQGVVSAAFQPSTSAAQGLLERNMAALRSALEGQGLTVEKLTVHASTHTSQSHMGRDNTPQDQSNQNAAQQHRQHGDAAGQQSRGRRDPDQPAYEPRHHRNSSFAESLAEKH